MIPGLPHVTLVARMVSDPLAYDFQRCVVIVFDVTPTEIDLAKLRVAVQSPKPVDFADFAKVSNDRLGPDYRAKYEALVDRHDALMQRYVELADKYVQSMPLADNKQAIGITTLPSFTLACTCGTSAPCRAHAWMAG